MDTSTNAVRLAGDDTVAEITLDDGRGNALNRPVLEALDAALAEAASSRAVLLRGREQVFCGGLDVPALLELDRPGMLDFLGLFDRVHLRLLGYPRPLVVEARGSAIAGGAILLAAGDDRIVGVRGSVGINEVALGLNFPTTALEIVRCALGAQGLELAATTGRLFTGDERRAVGFATEVVDDPAAVARERAHARAAVDPHAFALLRKQIRRAALARVAAHGEDDRRAFLDRWDSPGARERLEALARRLRKS